MTQPDPVQPTILDALFNLFSDVRRGEGVKVVLMAMNIFLLMTSYYIIKPAREALILAEEGAVAKSYLMAGIAVLLIVLVPLYAKLVDKLGRNQLILGVTAFFACCMGVFWLLSRGDVPRLGMAFFVWVGIFNVMIVAQFWSFANDVCQNEDGKRLFPIIAAGGSVGAAVGAWIAGRLLRVVGTYELLLVSAGILLLCIGLSFWVGVLESRKPATSPARNQVPIGGSGSVGFDLLLKHKYLSLIALLVLLLNLVNTNGEYLIGQLAEDFYRQETDRVVAHAAGAGEALKFGSTILGDASDPAVQQEYFKRSLGAFFSTFFFWVNIVSIGLQLFVVGRLVKYGGVKAALLMLPLIAFGTYGLIFVFPVLGYAWFGKMLENSTDYSVNNTVRHMLFLPTSREIKYKVKQVVDSFMHRCGDLVSAGVVFVGTQFSYGISGFAVLNVLVIAIWLGVLVAIIRLHRRLENGELPELTDSAWTPGE